MRIFSYSDSFNLEVRIRFNLLKKKRDLLYVRSQSVPRCKHFPPRLQKPVS
jgi:hypothetical protein